MASSSKISVKTTFPTTPLPSATARAVTLTPRLLLRPLTPNDLTPTHLLRTQHNVMVWTSTGTVDADLQSTQTWLDRYLPPNDATTYNWAMIVRDGEHKGEWIGVGGCHLIPGPEGWPEVGYMLREEFWGGGFGTEFMRAFLELWWGLPRSEVEIEVTEDSVISGIGPNRISYVPELLLAETEAKNQGSNRILEKCRGEKFREWEDDGYDLVKWRMKRPSN